MILHAKNKKQAFDNLQKIRGTGQKIYLTYSDEIRITYGYFPHLEEIERPEQLTNDKYELVI